VDWAQVVVLWLHMLFGIFWFGSVLFANFVLGPVLLRQPLGRMREIVLPLAEQADRVIIPVALITITLGFLRGTVFGSIRSLESISSSYGITWLVALVAAVGTLAWGVTTNRAAQRELAGGADPRAATGKALRNAGVELLGFGVILSCMVLMRYGL
jgi:hypothetical protein